MATYFSLPAELRHKIIEYIVDSPQDPPEEFNSDDDDYASSSVYNHLYFNSRHGAADMMLTSKVFKEDVQNVLKRTSTFILPILDLMAFWSPSHGEGKHSSMLGWMSTGIPPPKHSSRSYRLLQATWLLPPRFSRPVIEMLDIRVRNVEGFYDMEEDSEEPNRLLRRSLPHILGRFRSHDPYHFFDTIVAKGIFVKKIRINFMTPNDHPDYIPHRPNTDPGHDINPVWTIINGFFEYIGGLDKAEIREFRRLTQEIELALNDNWVYRFLVPSFDDYEGQALIVSINPEYLGSLGFRMKLTNHGTSYWSFEIKYTRKQWFFWWYASYLDYRPNDNES